MDSDHLRASPGRVRDAILHVLGQATTAMSVKDLETRLALMVGPTPPSSIRSYLRLNTPELFVRESRGVYRLRSPEAPATDQQANLKGHQPISIGRAKLINADCFNWLRERELNSIHAVVTDPPYGLHEYTEEQKAKLRSGRGGVWRIPPSFDGSQRSPLPRFTTLTPEQLIELSRFFELWGRTLLPKLVPGAHVLVASNPLVSFIVSKALHDAGLERRGEIVRLTTTLRGGDRPKDAHDEYSNVTVMPRSRWEPWLVFRRPIEGRVQDNLRRWKTGGFRRVSEEKPFADVIVSSPTRSAEKSIAPHPSLKPQAFMRQIVRAVLPLGEGIILDPFTGAGSTLAAAENLGYKSIGIESDESYFLMAKNAIPKLSIKIEIR
jgi:DNA modification methylase